MCRLSGRSAYLRSQSGDRRNRKKDRGKKSNTKGEGDRKTDRAPFRVRDVDLVIPRGQLVAIVGPVGSVNVSQLLMTKISL